jgi:2-phospho-L-lactate guanylyltransferase
VPVKRLDRAKTRLARPDRKALALAMALDTVHAARACRPVAGVVVVSDDPVAARALQPVAEVVPDEPDRGLNPALEHGAAIAFSRWPECGVAALASDLPALRPAELAVALTAAAEHPQAVVADGAGHGTVLLTARPGTRLEPRFGPGSRAAHVGTGAVDVSGRLPADPLPGLRRDVDTTTDLDQAVELGVGAETARVLAARAPSAQVTVRSWSPAGGDAVTDDGTVLALPGESGLRGSLRQLRAGQRVRVTMSPTSGSVSEIALITE